MTYSTAQHSTAQHSTAQHSTAQKEIFATSEGDQYFLRNSRSGGSQINDNDVIVDLLRFIELRPKKALEIGCSSGDRLDLIKRAFDAECWGVDPSSKAIEDGKIRFPEILLQVGTADILPFENNSFDVIIFGFCLYLCDRNDLFKIAYEADRCLKNEGTLIIKDFYPAFPFKNKYSHHNGVFSYKMDYSKMFSWNPSYAEVAKVVFSLYGFECRDIPNEKVAVIVLRKNEQYAYPEEPFK